jgi:amino acid adenylation domain-containing protein
MDMLVDHHPIYDRKVDSARRYWLRALSTNYENAIIPMGHSGRAQGEAEVPLPLAISGASFERLTTLTAGSSFLLYVALLAIVKLCLYKYSRSDVIAVSGPSRRGEGESPASAHTLVLVDKLDGNMSFRALLLNVKETVAEAYQYENYPLRDFIDDLEITEEKQFRPQIMLALKEFHGDNPPLRSDIALMFERRQAEAHGKIDFDDALFSPEIIKRFRDDFLWILELALQNTNAPISELSALTPTERRQLLLEWNDTVKSFPANHCVQDLFDLQAGKTPEAMAIVFEDRHLTYFELSRRANQLAHYLIAGGVGPEERVALCLERSLETIIGVLAVLKAGGVYIPLDPNYPTDRLSYMLNDSRAAILLTQQDVLNHLPLTSARTVCLDHEWERIRGEAESEPRSWVEAENLAYLIYTSGSTGNPKGVMITHKGLCNLVEAEKQALELDDQSRVLQFASLSFDASVWEIFSALVAGGTLHMRKPGNLAPGEDLLRALRECQITIVTLPPTALAMLAREELPNLQTIVAAGEACSIEIVGRWARGRRFLDAYGPTEATVCASLGECEADSQSKPAIGRPIANKRLYILDGELSLVPAGVQGDLYIAGVGLARGYWERPELTAERFIPDLFSNEGGERFYRSGDVCKHRLNGEIEFIGRADAQVKMRGYRIELGEIESVLGEHRLVRQSAVVAHEDGTGGKRLVGYVMGEEGTTAVGLKRYLRERLPEYMIPEAILVLKEMPLSANGKIDRKRLAMAPLLNDTGRQVEQEYAEARTPVEEILAGIFEEVLKVDQVGIKDNFFEVGGHSLLATRVTSRVRNTFEVEIGVKSIFEEPTVERLARKIEEAIRVGKKIEAIPLIRISREEKLPLSFAQQRLWFLEQLEPGKALYNCTGALRMEGGLNLDALEKVINEIVRRHEALRSRIDVAQDEPAVIIDAWEHRELEVEDLAGLTREQRETEVKRKITDDVRRGFDLTRGPLIRVKLLKLGEEEHVALFTMHHIVSDAWSIGVLVREFCDLYKAISEGRPSPLPELEIQYADYAYWQRRYLRGEVLEEHSQYWKKQLGGKLPSVSLASDFPRPETPSYRGVAKSIALPEALCESLKALSKREGVTLFMTLLAAFKTLLYRYTMESDILIGVPNAARNRTETECLIGFFVNMLPIRTDLGGNPRFTQLLKRVREVMLGAYAHQEMPFEKLVEAVQPERELRQAPLFTIAFGVQNAPKEEVRMAGLKIIPLSAGLESSRFDLTLWITEGAGTIMAGWIYSADLFKEETIIRMHGHFETLLSNIISRPDAPLDKLEMLTEAEREQQSINRLTREEYYYSRFKSIKPRAVALSED